MCLECALPAARWMSKVKGWPPRNPTCFIIEGGHPVKFLCTWSWLYMWPPLLNVNISKWEGSACAFSGAGTLLPPALSLSSDGWGWGGYASSSQRATSPKRLLLRPRPRTSHISLLMWKRIEPSSEVTAGREQVLPGDRWIVFPCERWQWMGLT